MKQNVIMSGEYVELRLRPKETVLRESCRVLCVEEGGNLGEEGGIFFIL